MYCFLEHVDGRFGFVGIHNGIERVVNVACTCPAHRIVYNTLYALPLNNTLSSDNKIKLDISSKTNYLSSLHQQVNPANSQDPICTGSQWSQIRSPPHWSSHRNSLALLGPFQVYNGSLGSSVDQYHRSASKCDSLRLTWRWSKHRSGRFNNPPDVC